MLENIILGCSIVLIVFNLSDRKSYNNAIKIYKKLEELKSTAGMIKIMIGNKTDLKDDEKYGNYNHFINIYNKY